MMVAAIPPANSTVTPEMMMARSGRLGTLDRDLRFMVEGLAVPFDGPTSEPAGLKLLISNSFGSVRARSAQATSLDEQHAKAKSTASSPVGWRSGQTR
jgi:hypothetical protein